MDSKKIEYVVIRTEYKGSNNDSNIVDRVIIGKYETFDEADNAISLDVSDFRDHHDNDERIDWDHVVVVDDIGTIRHFIWSIVKLFTD